MWIALLVCLGLLGRVAGSKKDGKMGGRSRALVYKGATGTLLEQYITMKQQLATAYEETKELIVVYNSDDRNGVNGHNLCDIFELPGEVKCEKHMKMKCLTGNSTSDSEHGKEDAEKSHKKKIPKVSFNCAPTHFFETAERVNAATEHFHTMFPLKLQEKRTEEVQYVQAMMGVVKKQTKKVVPYTAVYWGDGHLHLGHTLGVCSAGPAAPEESPACRDFKLAVTALAEVSKPYCNPPSSLASLGESKPEGLSVHAHGAGTCYIAGATEATAQEAAILLDAGLQSFRGLWLQHPGKADSKGGASALLSKLSAAKLAGMLVHIAPASVEVMEWGLMLDATTFVSLTSGPEQALQAEEASERTRQQAGGVLVLTNFVEYERARAGKTFCTSHRDHLTAAAKQGNLGVDTTWCGKIASSGYVFKDLSPSQVGQDDGPFDNPALNKMVISVALSLMHVFSSRILQLGLGFLCVILLLGVMRLCYVRWRRTSTKTF